MSLELEKYKNLVRKLKIPAQINCILVWQGLVTICITAILYVLYREVAVSALLGGMVCVLPNIYFAKQVFTKSRTAAAGTLLRTVYIAEFIKMGLAIALLAIALIKYKEVNPIALFVTYFIAHSCTWVVPLITHQANYKSSKKIINQTVQ
jgi:ATP synthase protein I